MKRSAAFATFAALAWAALAFSAAPAAAQTACPAFTQGRVLTPAQWQACFDAKQNSLGYTPVNKAGDTMLGRLQMSPSNGTRAGINIGVGTQPVSPVNGDIWMSVGGMFAQVNNVTVGPFGSALTTQAPSTIVANCQVFNAIPGECTIGATLSFVGTALQTGAGTGDATWAQNSFATTVGKVNGVAYPSGPSTNTVPVVTGANTVTYQAVPNAALANSAITIAGSPISLGGSITASAILDSIGSTRGSVIERGASGWAILAPGTAGLPLTSGGAGADPTYAALANAALQNSTITIGSTSMALGSTNSTIAGALGLSGTVTASGTLNVSGTFQIGGTAVALPVSLANGGTAANLTASNGGVVYSTASALAVLAGTPSAGQCLLSGSNAAPSWGSCAGGAAVASVSNADGSLTVSPTTGAVVASLNLGNANAWTAAQTIAATSSGAFRVGINTTNPAFNVDTSTGSSATGFNVKSAAAGGGVAVQAISSGTNENLAIDAKGSGTITLGGTSTGNIVLNRALSGTVNVTGTFQAGGNTQTFPGSAASLAALNLTNQTLSGGANVTANNLGTVSSFTANCGLSPLQFGTNNGAFTLTAPANDGSCIIRVTNGASAGAITFSGWTVGTNTGDTYATTNANKYDLFIRRINGVSSYQWSALQ